MSLAEGSQPPIPHLGPPRDRTIALVGLMGGGKTSIGKRRAQALNLPFRDADHEIEAAAGCSVADIFAERGEEAFRDGERRVIARLMDGEPHVLATGGGAFVQDETRQVILSRGIAVRLKADLGVLARRVSRKNTRPMLAGKDPMEVLKVKAEERYPHYAQAHLTVDTGDLPHGVTVDAIIRALTAHQKDHAA